MVTKNNFIKIVVLWLASTVLLVGLARHYGWFNGPTVVMLTESDQTSAQDTSSSSELKDKVSLPSTSSKDNNVVQSQRAAKNAPPTTNTNNVKDNVQDKSVVNHKNIFVHPKNDYKELWIVMSKAYVVRRLAYLDKTIIKDVTIRLVSLKDKRSYLPGVHLMLHYTDATKQPICVPTHLDYGAVGGLDNYEVYLVRTERLNPDQYNSLSHITISTDTSCKGESDSVSIQTLEPKEFQYTYGLCLHKGVGSDFDPKVLLNWVKLNVALGAELITIYIQTGAEGVYDILLPYINKGIVEILDWKLEPEFTNGGSHHYGQTGVIVECIWRNIYRVKYLGMNDADEFFMPLKHNSVPEMMAAIEKMHGYDKPVASFAFTNTLLKGNKTLSVVKETLQSKQCSSLDEATLPPYFIRTTSCLQRGTDLQKLIVRPDGVYIPWVHWIMFHRKDEYTREYPIPEDIGLSYHYRPHWKKYGGCSTPENETQVVGKFFKRITKC